MFDTHEQMKESIVIAPQCPTGKRWVETDWTKGNYDSSAIEEVQLATVMEILESVQEKYNTDDDRIYTIGISMGGFGAWNLLMNHSDVFAAGIPMCAGADPNKADVLKDIPIWTFHGTADATVPYAGTAEMYNAIVSAGGNELKFTTYTGSPHAIWETVATTDGLIEWLFAQTLSGRTEAKRIWKDC
jgi:predicted peptidase